MVSGKKAGIIACSNGVPVSRREQVEKTAGFLESCGLKPSFSSCLYERNHTSFSGSPKKRAKELMRLFNDPDMAFIFDVSGGDAANGILPFLDFEEIRKSRAVFWGYSDLTTVINGIYAKTGKPSVLYQARHLAAEDGDWQRAAFQKLASCQDTDIFDFSYKFLQGNHMEGTVAGGNMRCLLKLAGTGFWPDMKGKILLLEAMGGLAPQMASCLAQLKQLGVFEQVNGILLGTFLAMEEKEDRPKIEELVLQYAGKEIPVARTEQIGHRTDSHGIWIEQKAVFT